MQLPFKSITSKDNPAYRQVKALREPRKARKAGLILVEGFRQVEEALAAGLSPRWLLTTGEAQHHERWPRLQEWLLSMPDLLDTCQMLVLSEHLFADLAATQTPQGVAIVVASPMLLAAAELPDLAPPDCDGLYLVLETVQDPGNLGTMIRLADAFAFSAVMLAGPTADPFSEKALRAAMGSAFHVPVMSFPSIESAAAWLGLGKIPLLAADLAGEALSATTALPRSAALLIGNEGSGLSVQALALARQRIRIDMPGRAESLNAAAAAAILCHALAAGRRDGPDVGLVTDGLA
jgi:TrmH family RNA methyltransferase